MRNKVSSTKILNVFNWIYLNGLIEKVSSDALRPKLFDQWDALALERLTTQPAYEDRALGHLTLCGGGGMCVYEREREREREREMCVCVCVCESDNVHTGY